MSTTDELSLRRHAVRLFLRGTPVRRILRLIPRSRSWLYKWLERFRSASWPALRSQSRRPHSAPHAYSAAARANILRAYHILQHRTVGLCGPAAIQAELRSWSHVKRLPSIATIKRILHAAGIPAPPAQPKRAFYPQPVPSRHYGIHAMDWTERYLPGGQKVYAFHTIDLQSRAIKQTISTDKSLDTVRRHLFAVWSNLGCPDALQMDNDGAFCGGYKVPRVFGQVVRLCLYLGIEPIFIPVGEAKRNGLVERLNGLWSTAFWRRQRFADLAEVVAASPQFEAWYMQQYRPPPLHGQSPAQVVHAGGLPLSRAQWESLPQQLPISAGRVHFVRLVDSSGAINLLNERWQIGKRWAGRYVWATVITHKHELRIYYRANAQAEVRLLHQWPYRLAEPVRPVEQQFQRSYRRRKMSTML